MMLQRGWREGLMQRGGGQERKKSELEESLRMSAKH